METDKICLVLMLFCFGTLRAKDVWTQEIIDFINVVNGRHTNSKQVADETARNAEVRHAPSSGTFRPVEIPAMGPVPVLLLEEVFFDQVVRREILVVRERTDGTIQLIPFNFTGNFLAKPGQFDVNTLESLTLDDFSTVGNCDGTFIQLNDGYFIGRWPNCKFSVDGVHPEFIFGLSCDSMIIEATHGAEEQSPEPYILLLEGQKFPLPKFVNDSGAEDICS